MTKYPFDWSLDEDGYPEEESLIHLRTYLDTPDTNRADFLVYVFPKLVKSIPCGSVQVDNHGRNDKSYYLILYSTGGWSGQESLINTVLDCKLLKWSYHQSWRRGGHYEFYVPKAEMTDA